MSFANATARFIGAGSTPAVSSEPVVVEPKFFASPFQEPMSLAASSRAISPEAAMACWKFSAT